MAKLKKGDTAKLKRGSIENNIIVASEYRDDYYIVENNIGFMPNKNLIEKFGLDKDKKYLFAKEGELTKD